MRVIHVVGIVVLTALLSISGIYFVLDKNYKQEASNKDTDSELENSPKMEDKEEFVSTVDTQFGWENPVFSMRIDEWKSGDEPFVDNLVEEVLQQMSHQKIIADEKESSIMITPERIDTLLQMVEENKDNYEYSEQYLDVLNRWKLGDFSSVDQDHNDLWFLQGSKQGGIAYGIATKEQEIDYIFRVFAKEVVEVFGSSIHTN
ncbi:DUF6241 domain-containing protein [Lysinibacillus fusiformis]|uniref:DUF6241 domain-containing protein n=1 Tax=Lysinibacillus fusiformis TaxID=28031 RepID=UPI002D7A3678|nr:DUF6241 domain-containing protein [Lysinibacillus fusiformis]WRS96704.1 DUF6241 domain-containing protein [Lysinibacillus fusiformis]